MDRVATWRIVALPGRDLAYGRVGYIYDVYYELNTIAAGIGYSDPAFAIDFGFQHEIRDRGRFLLSFGLRIFLS